MKKLLIAIVMLGFASGASAMELGEADSKDMYKALSAWGTRWWDKEHKRVLIQVSDVRCIRSIDDISQGPIYGCGLRDDLHEKDKTRTGGTARLLSQLVAKHVGVDCNNGTCMTGARIIRCWHPWDDKYDPPVLVPRRWICWINQVN